MQRTEAVQFLLERPAQFGHLVGFNKLTDLHNGWIQEMVRGTDDFSLMASRLTYKTTCVSLSLALDILLLPNLRSMFMRKTDNDVKEIIKQVQKILQDPHTQYFSQCIYGVPIKLLVQSATEISTNLSTDAKGTSQIVGIGTGGSLTGKHFDRIFSDDIININDRISKAERDHTKLIYQELQNIKNRGGKIVNTLTPWHRDDASTLMPNIVKYNCYHPEVRKLISEEQLNELKSKMLPSLFAANYELRHIAAEDVIFTDPQKDAEPALAEQGITHIDAAFGGADYTALTICKRKDGKYYIYGRLWHKGIDDLFDEIMKEHKRFMSTRLHAEDNGDKGYTGKTFRKMGARVSIYHEDMNKFIKITTYLKEVWEDVVFVEGTDAEYIDQICDFNENAEHDDAPDSAASVIRIYSRKGETEYKPLWN